MQHGKHCTARGTHWAVEMTILHRLSAKAASMEPLDDFFSFQEQIATVEIGQLFILLKLNLKKPKTGGPFCIHNFQEMGLNDYTKLSFSFAITSCH